MRRSNITIERCERCNKAKHPSAGSCRRAARRLSVNDHNEKRVFHPKRCDCRGKPWIIATTQQREHDLDRRRRMEASELAIEQEEREEIVSAMIEDARLHMTDPNSHWSWLSRLYGDKTAQEIVDATYQAIKEPSK
jgi:hypothetical protein